MKMKQGSKAYNAEAIQLALSRVDIGPCVKCGHPILEVYCCILLRWGIKATVCSL